MSIVALHVVATIVDYYITKYAAKPMEQLQNLTTQYALGMRRLEEKEEREKAQRVQAGGDPQPANSQDELKGAVGVFWSHCSMRRTARN